MDDIEMLQDASTRVLHDYPPHDCDSMVIRGASDLSKFWYLKMRREQEEKKTTTPSTSFMLEEPIQNLINKAEHDLVERLLLQPQPDEPLPVPTQQSDLWVDQFSPKTFTDLLSDSSTNIHLLKWIRGWDRVVFNKEPPFKETIDAKDEALKIKPFVLIHGPPGIGKTTLVHLAAKQAGYHLQEINSSDERTATTLIQRLQTFGTTNTVPHRGLPSLLLIDEADGLADEKAGQALLTLLTKQKDSLPVIKRPVVLVCNDVYARCLRPLREKGLLLKVTPPGVPMIAHRLMWIAKMNRVRLEEDAAEFLVRGFKSDIRACVNTLQFLSRQVFVKKEARQRDADGSKEILERIKALNTDAQKQEREREREREEKEKEEEKAREKEQERAREKEEEEKEKEESGERKNSREEREEDEIPLEDEPDYLDDFLERELEEYEAGLGEKEYVDFVPDHLLPSNIPPPPATIPPPAAAIATPSAAVSTPSAIVVPPSAAAAPLSTPPPSSPMGVKKKKNSRPTITMEVVSHVLENSGENNQVAMGKSRLLSEGEIFSLMFSPPPPASSLQTQNPITRFSRVYDAVLSASSSLDVQRASSVFFEHFLSRLHYDTRLKVTKELLSLLSFGDAFSSQCYRTQNFSLSSLPFLLLALSVTLQTHSSPTEPPPSISFLENKLRIARERRVSSLLSLRSSPTSPSLLRTYYSSQFSRSVLPFLLHIIIPAKDRVNNTWFKAAGRDRQIHSSVFHGTSHGALWDLKRIVTLFVHYGMTLVRHSSGHYSEADGSYVRTWTTEVSPPVHLFVTLEGGYEERRGEKRWERWDKEKRGEKEEKGECCVPLRDLDGRVVDLLIHEIKMETDKRKIYGDGERDESGVREEKEEKQDKWHIERKGIFSGEEKLANAINFTEMLQKTFPVSQSGIKRPFEGNEGESREEDRRELQRDSGESREVQEDNAERSIDKETTAEKTTVIPQEIIVKKKIPSMFLRGKNAPPPDVVASNTVERSNKKVIALKCIDSAVLYTFVEGHSAAVRRPAKLDSFFTFD